MLHKTTQEIINAVEYMEKGVRKYNNLKKLFVEGKKDEFEKEFCSFYRVNMRRKNKEWKDKFFKVMGGCKGKDVSFEDVLEKVKDEVGSYESSFVSKYLNLLDENRVIWDSNVLRVLKIKVKVNNYNDRVKLWECKRVYSEIDKWYKEFLGGEEVKEWIRIFDELLEEYKGMSDVRKVDFFLWVFGDKKFMKM